MVQAQPRELLNQKEAQVAFSRPIQAATQRLAAALDRLEDNVLRGRREPVLELEQSQQLAFFEQESASLRSERDDLNHVINDLQSQYDELHKVASRIYNKLDDSIKRLTQIIEN